MVLGPKGQWAPAALGQFTHSSFHVFIHFIYMETSILHHLQGASQLQLAYLSGAELTTYLLPYPQAEIFPPGWAQGQALGALKLGVCIPGKVAVNAYKCGLTFQTAWI